MSGSPTKITKAIRGNGEINGIISLVNTFFMLGSIK